MGVGAQGRQRTRVVGVQVREQHVNVLVTLQVKQADCLFKGGLSEIEKKQIFTLSEECVGIAEGGIEGRAASQKLQFHNLLLLYARADKAVHELLLDFA